MYLVDTNCWIQLARNRAQADEVRLFMGGVPLPRLFVSIYTVHGIGIILHRRGMIDQYADFLNRSRIGTGIGVIDVPPNQLGVVAQACVKHNLDFDDAYQYVAAELPNLTVVSLDADFDHTPRGRLTPAAALHQFTDEQRQQQQQQPQQP